MTSTEIRTLLQPPSSESSEARALSYLNSTFHSLDDLDGDTALEQLVEQARQQQAELDEKLAQSSAALHVTVTETRRTAGPQLHTAQELSLMRHTLADELAFLSSELVSSLSGPEDGSTLLEDLEALHRSLKELESVKGYVRVVEHALKLSEAAVEEVRNSGAVTVREYEALQDFVATVAEASRKVEDVASQHNLHILTFLENVLERTWKDMKGVLSATILTASEKLRWPLRVDYAAASPEDRRAFEAAFGDLLKLQTIGQKIRKTVKGKERAEEGLYPIQALIQPISLRFKYHFEGTRQTNRLDKPEWYFTHVLNESHEHRSFMESVVQSLLSTTEYRGINAWREFTLQLFPLLERKIRRTIPALLAHPSILAHTIYQALAFDSSLKEAQFDVDGTTAARSVGDEEKQDDKFHWQGISDVILGRKEWFDTWVEGERKFAMDQYLEIISAPDAWHIADDDEEDAVVDRELKPTNSARKVKALVEQVTDRYSPLPQYSHRTRFLIVVQLPLLESYHARISASLDAFETLSSTLMRAVPGALTGNDGSGRGGESGRLTAGVEGTQRLCKALVSTKYLAAAMEAWGEEMFFLELWAEINHKASLRSKVQSERSLPDPSDEGGPLEGTIFEELVRFYTNLAGRAEEIIVQCVCGEVEAGLKAHFSATSTQVTPNAAADDIAISQTLLGPIALLSTHLSFLRSTLPRTTVTSLYRRISSRLAQHILQRQILYRGRARIALPEARGIFAEAELWVETCRLALGRVELARVQGPWRPLLHAAGLLAADGDAWTRVEAATFGTAGDEEWEEAMLADVGICALQRDEVQQVLRRRDDCDR